MASAGWAATRHAPNALWGCGRRNTPGLSLWQTDFVLIPNLQGVSLAVLVMRFCDPCEAQSGDREANGPSSP